MADLIMDDNACMVVGQAAWHGKGVRLDIPPNTAEALRLARLDWRVYKEPVFVRLGDATARASSSDAVLETDSFATVRYDACGRPHFFGIVGKRYEVLQNHEAFEVFDRIMIDRGCVYESAGAVRDGRRVWILARVPDEFRVADDRIREFLLVVLSHDGSTPLVLKPTPVRVVCNNTLNLALGGREAQFSIRHTLSIRSRLIEAARAVSGADMDFQKAKESMECMAERRLPDPTRYFFTVLPELRNWNNSALKRNVWRDRFDALQTLFVAGRGNHGRSVWDAYNAVVEWVDHGRNPKDWVEWTQFGSGALLKRRAFEQGVELATKTTIASGIDLEVPTWTN